ncbi:MAG: sigma 54-interacting transcriptional regulator [Blastocatellia bacterium]|nr:sigma 54-interacting transcriptional regulator [Blastocatellia bacterium]
MSAQDVIFAEDALQQQSQKESMERFRDLLSKPGLSLQEEVSIRLLYSKSLEIAGNYDNAIEVLKIYDPISVSVKERAEIDLRLGCLYKLSGNLPKAIALLNQAIKNFKESGYEASIGEAYYMLASSYIESEEYKIARDYLLEAVEYQRKSSESSFLSWIYLKLGFIEYKEQNLSSAKNYFCQALSLAKELKDTLLQSVSQINLANVEYNLAELDEAQHLYQSAIEYLELLGHTKLLGIAYNLLAKVLIFRGEWTLAEEVLSKSLHFSQFSNNQLTQAITTQIIGYLKYQQGIYEKAEACLLASLETLSTFKDSSYLAESYRLLALTAKERNLYDQAFDYSKRSLQLTFKSNPPSCAAVSYMVIAQIHLEKNELRTAEDFLNMAKAKLEQEPKLELAGYLQRLIGKLKFALKDFHAARAAFNQSISLLKTAKSVYQLALSNFEMGLFLAEIGDCFNATTYLEAASQTFSKLNLNKLEEIARSKILSFPNTLVPATDYYFSFSKNFEPSYVERLLEASHQTELILREFVSIAFEVLAASSVAIFQFDDIGKISLIVNQGEIRAKTPAIIELVRQQNFSNPRLSPRTMAVKFTDASKKRELIFFAEKQSDPSEQQTLFFQTLLHLTCQSLEICGLRERLKTTREFDVSSLKFLSSMPDFLVHSTAMKTVLEQIHKIRSSTVTVLITGESGTGKELIARAIHYESDRRDKEFVPFNCASVAKDMVESRLFGHRRGAFTGASQDQKGVIRAAEGGTLFLDEIGELPIEVQPKLLRFLQEGEIHTLGDDRPQHVNVRIIAATNRNLEDLVNNRLFREDLFHRLNVIRIHIPPLRERREEIFPLVEHFLKIFSERMEKNVRLSEEVAEKLYSYNWPGNIRQLQNEIERIVSYAEEKHIATIDDISPEIASYKRAKRSGSIESTNGSRIQVSIPMDATLAEAVEVLERFILSDMLKKNRGNISRTARQLGLTRKGLQMKRTRLGL